jgi:hypothetical protein
MKRNIAVCRIFSPLRTANVACFQRQIQLSGFSAYPNVSPSELIRIIAVLLYLEYIIQVGILCVKSSINIILCITRCLLYTVSRTRIKEHVVSRVRAGRSGFRISAGSNISFFSPNRLDRTCGPNSIPFCGYRGFFPAVKRSERDDQVVVWLYSP